MRYLREAEYPVPAVFAVAGADLVMQRLYGRDMLADLASRPWRLARHARTLAGSAGCSCAGSWQPCGRTCAHTKREWPGTG